MHLRYSRLISDYWSLMWMNVNSRPLRPAAAARTLHHGRSRPPTPPPLNPTRRRPLSLRLRPSLLHRRPSLRGVQHVRLGKAHALLPRRALSLRLRGVEGV